MMTYDVVAHYMSDNMIRCVTVWTLAISAVLTFALAFAVTSGANFKCWLSTLRWVQRLVLCAMSISMAYGAAYIIDYSYTPPGPFAIFFVLTMIAIILSALRHLSAPPITPYSSWGHGLHFARDRVRKLLMGHGHEGSMRPR